MDDLRCKFRNKDTIRSYFGMIDKINRHYGWEEKIVHYDLIADRARDIMELLKQWYHVPNPKVLKEKLSKISGVMTRCIGHEDHVIKSLIRNMDREVPTESGWSTLRVDEVPEWTELQPKLTALASTDSVPGIVALVYSYGYVFRVGQLFDTLVNEDDGVHNYWDTYNSIWKMRIQKNRTEIDVDVDRELSDRFQYYQGWLLAKANGAQYSSKTLTDHHWTLPENRIIRKSYETWNHTQSGRDLEEITKWNNWLGHSHVTSKDYYVQS